jgi:hypothetical protein
MQQDEKLGKEKGKIQISLRQDYILLADLKDSALADLYKQYENAIFDKLNIRNYSILAHGLRPINKKGYQEFAKVICEFIQQGLKQCLTNQKTPLFSDQFPTTFS